MSKSYRTCAGCGARLSSDAGHCDLCGTPTHEAEAAETTPVATEDPVFSDASALSASVVVPEASDETPSMPSAERPAGVFCNQCGWQNPVGARYCTMCGAPLQSVNPAALSPSPPPASPPAPRPPVPSESVTMPPAARAEEEVGSAGSDLTRQAVTRQVGIIVGAGFLLVVALFMVTAVSKTRPAEPPLPAASAPASTDVTPGQLPPLAASLVEQAEALEAEIAQRTGEAQTDKRRDLVAFFAGSGRLDRAAFEQQKVAEATSTADDWKHAGDLFYDWMSSLQGPQKAQVALRAIDAYQRVLAVNPDNLDVRTDMATAYLSSNNPMQGVAEIKRVLEADPNHLHARFNYGIMLAMIGRTELAVEQFEQVKTLVDASSSYYRQADEAIRVIQSGGSL